MHHAFFRDPAISESDIYYMSDPATAGRTRSIAIARDPDIDAKLLPWGVIPDQLDPTRVLKLCIDHDDASVDDLPEAIRRLPNLLWLNIPRRFVAKLAEASIPPTVHTLGLTGGGKATLPKSLVLPDLRRLMAGRDETVKFSLLQLPNVEELSLKLDPGGSLLREVVGMEKLVALAALPFSNGGILEAVAGLPLRYLKAKSGESRHGRALALACGSLTDLWLEDLNKLTSIASLAELPRLRELSVTYCGNLRLDRSLLRFPALRRLFFFACKDIGLTPIRLEIERLGLEHFLASGTT